MSWRTTSPVVLLLWKRGNPERDQGCCPILGSEGEHPERSRNEENRTRKPDAKQGCALEYKAAGRDLYLISEITHKADSRYRIRITSRPDRADRHYHTVSGHTAPARLTI